MWGKTFLDIGLVRTSLGLKKRSGLEGSQALALGDLGSVVNLRGVVRALGQRPSPDELL